MEPNEEERRLYDYLIDNFPLGCNSHNALLHAPNSNLKPTVEDIAIFVLEQIKKRGTYNE
jgi:hypothetical protein